MITIQKLGRGITAALLALVLIFNSNTEVKAQHEYVDMEIFYNELAPYGNWYDDPEYGYVWQPRGIQNFQPYYTNGYWVMTEYGNTWVSNYNWGWAPFHYGRWHMSHIGWVWIPGNQWGPAWVDWRHGNGYYGWAPLGPSTNITIGGWRTPADWFVFVPQGNIYNRGFNRYYRPNNYMNIYNNTIIVNNYYNDRNNRPLYNAGPRRDDIHRYTNRDIPVYNVTNAQTRGATAAPRGNNIAIYRPEVRQANNNAAPRNVRSINEASNNRATATTSRSAQTATQNTNTNTQNRASNNVRTNAPVQNVERNTNSQTRSTNNNATIRQTNSRTVQQPANSSSINRSTSAQNNSNVNSTNRSSNINRSANSNNRSSVAPASQQSVQRSSSTQVQRSATNSRPTSTPAARSNNTNREVNSGVRR